MNTLSAAERKRVTDYIAETGVLVLKTVQSLSAEQLNFRPKHDRWSIVEVVDHLTIVDRLVLNQIREVVGTQRAVKKSVWKGQDDVLLEKVRCRLPPLRAPEIILPRNELEPKETLRQFEAMHTRVKAYGAETEAQLRSFCFPHPVYGELDCYQWLLCMGAHCERHLSQIREVIESSDFPGIASATNASFESTTLGRCSFGE